MSVLNAIALPRLITGWKELNALCANRDCHPSSLLQNISRKREGIRIGDQWYCSPDCFEEIVQDRLAELCRPGITPPLTRRFRVPLGLILLSRGCINNDQLQFALKKQSTDRRRIGDILAGLGYATERQVTAAVAAQWGYPVFSLEGRVAETQIQLPLSLLELHSILPVHYSPTARKLMIGFVNRVDNGLLHAIEQMTATVTFPCFITPSDFNLQLAWLARAIRKEEVRFDRVTSPFEMARIVRSYAVEVAAEEARFSRFSDHIWSRVVGRRHEIDLLFKLPVP